MTLLAGGVMVGSGILCLGTAARGRHPLPIAAALLMVLAMADVVLWGSVAPVLWAFLLALAGILAAAQLRRPAASLSASGALAGWVMPGLSRTPGGRARAAGRGWQHWTLVGAALAYPAAGWLLLRHPHQPLAPTGVVGSASGLPDPALPGPVPAHAGHGTPGELFVLVPTLAICVLVLGLLCGTGLALWHRRRLVAAESAGMAAMLLVMLVLGS